MNFRNFILALATVTIALVAGVFYAFSIAVNPAFTTLDDTAYIQAMQAINKAIVNPWFALSFFGGPVFLLWCTVLHLRPYSFRSGLIIAACVIYLLGGLGVTVFGNIPLNDQLESFIIQEAPAEQIAQVRKDFVSAWNGWHTVRTVASATALLLLVMACLRKRISVHVLRKNQQEA